MEKVARGKKREASGHSRDGESTGGDQALKTKKLTSGNSSKELAGGNSSKELAGGNSSKELAEIHSSQEPDIPPSRSSKPTKISGLKTGCRRSTTEKKTSTEQSAKQA